MLLKPWLHLRLTEYGPVLPASSPLPISLVTIKSLAQELKDRIESLPSTPRSKMNPHAENDTQLPTEHLTSHLDD